MFGKIWLDWGLFGLARLLPNYRIIGEAKSKVNEGEEGWQTCPPSLLSALKPKGRIWSKNKHQFY